MDQHERGEWASLVKSAFCSDANVSVNLATDDFVATVLWPLPTDHRPYKLSKQIRLVITKAALRGYFEKDESSRREQDEENVTEWIRKQLQHFDDDHEEPRGQSPPEVAWVIGTEVLNS